MPANTELMRNVPIKISLANYLILNTWIFFPFFYLSQFPTRTSLFSLPCFYMTSNNQENMMIILGHVFCVHRLIVWEISIKHVIGHPLSVSFLLSIYNYSCLLCYITSTYIDKHKCVFVLWLFCLELINF